MKMGKRGLRKALEKEHPQARGNALRRTSSRERKKTRPVHWKKDPVGKGASAMMRTADEGSTPEGTRLRLVNQEETEDDGRTRQKRENHPRQEGDLLTRKRPSARYEVWEHGPFDPSLRKGEGPKKGRSRKAKLRRSRNRRPVEPGRQRKDREAIPQGEKDPRPRRKAAVRPKNPSSRGSLLW